MERWGALESSPEVFTSLLEALCGGDACAYEVVDLFALDDEVLPMFPQVLAVIMAFPTGEQAAATSDAQQVCRCLAFCGFPTSFNALVVCGMDRRAAMRRISCDRSRAG